MAASKPTSWVSSLAAMALIATSFETLTDDLGCFPFDPSTFTPMVRPLEQACGLADRRLVVDSTEGELVNKSLFSRPQVSWLLA